MLSKCPWSFHFPETCINKLKKYSVSKIVLTFQCSNKLFWWSLHNGPEQFLKQNTTVVFRFKHVWFRGDFRFKQDFSKNYCTTKLNQGWTDFCNTLHPQKYDCKSHRPRFHWTYEIDSFQHFDGTIGRLTIDGYSVFWDHFESDSNSKSSGVILAQCTRGLSNGNFIANLEEIQNVLLPRLDRCNFGFRSILTIMCLNDRGLPINRLIGLSRRFSLIGLGFGHLIFSQKYLA